MFSRTSDMAPTRWISGLGFACQKGASVVWLGFIQMHRQLMMIASAVGLGFADQGSASASGLGLLDHGGASVAGLGFCC